MRCAVTFGTSVAVAGSNLSPSNGGADDARQPDWPSPSFTGSYVNRFFVLLLLGGAACAGQQPQVLTPVRVDTSRAGSVAAAPAPASAGAVAGPVARTTMDDPIARIDRMDWPGPNTFRSASGAPGPDYWQ